MVNLTNKISFTLWKKFRVLHTAVDSYIEGNMWLYLHKNIWLNYNLPLEIKPNDQLNR